MGCWLQDRERGERAHEKMPLMQTSLLLGGTDHRAQPSEKMNAASGSGGPVLLSMTQAKASTCISPHSCAAMAHTHSRP